MYTCIIPSYPLIPMDFCPSFPLQVWSPPRLSWRWPQISPARRWIARVDFRNLAPNGEFMANICLYGNFQGEFMAHLWQIYEIWKKCDFPKKSDWWFHRCFIFPYLGNVIIPTDELIFFRGVETTNQMANIWNVCSKIWSNPPEEHGVFVGNASMKTGHECSTIFVYRRVYVFLLFLSKKFQGFKQHNIEMSLAKHWD